MFPDLTTHGPRPSLPIGQALLKAAAATQVSLFLASHMKNTTNKLKPKPRRRRSRRTQTPANQTSALSLKLPVFQQLGTMSARLRFSNASALTDATLLIADFLNIVAVATSSTAVQPLFLAVKLKKVCLYSATNTGTEGAEPLDITWPTAQASPAVTTSSQLGVLPGTLIRSPPALLKLWQTRSATDAGTSYCKITCPADTVLDFHFDAILLGNPTAGITAVSSLSGLTTGIVYVGLKFGAQAVEPQGVPSYY